MSREIRCECLCAADGAHARTAAAVRHCEGLVKVKMANVGADEAGAGEPHLSVHIGSVHIDHAAVTVYDFYYLADLLLKNTVGGGVRYHQAGETVSRCSRLGLQLLYAGVALVVEIYYVQLKAGHSCGCRVGAMGAGGN